MSSAHMSHWRFWYHSPGLRCHPASSEWTVLVFGVVGGLGALCYKHLLGKELKGFVILAGGIHLHALIKRECHVAGAKS